MPVIITTLPPNTEKTMKIRSLKITTVCEGNGVMITGITFRVPHFIASEKCDFCPKTIKNGLVKMVPVWSYDGFLTISRSKYRFWEV